MTAEKTKRKQSGGGANPASVARELSERLQWATIGQARQVLHLALYVVARQLAAKGRLTLPQLGTFRVVERPARRILHPKTGAEVQLPAQWEVRFRPSLDMRNRVKASREPVLPVSIRSCGHLLPCACEGES